MYMELVRYTNCIHLSVNLMAVYYSIISCSQIEELHVSYSESGISDEAELKEAVKNGVYPPRISWEVLYRAISVGYSSPEFVCLEIAGSDRGVMNFLCKISIINSSCEASNG